jgi:hypothetical protein
MAGCFLQAFRQSPRLEEALDLGDEGRNSRLKRRVLFGGFEVVQELLAHEVGQCLLRAELVLDASGCLALLDPDFVQLHPLLLFGFTPNVTNWLVLAGVRNRRPAFILLSTTALRTRLPQCASASWERALIQSVSTALCISRRVP